MAETALVDPVQIWNGRCLPQKKLHRKFVFFFVLEECQAMYANRCVKMAYFFTSVIDTRMLHAWVSRASRNEKVYYKIASVCVHN